MMSLFRSHPTPPPIFLSTSSPFLFSQRGVAQLHLASSSQSVTVTVNRRSAAEQQTQREEGRNEAEQVVNK